MKAEQSGKVENYIPAMLAKDTDTPFSNDDWIFEIKWDGYRTVAEVNNRSVRLYSRNGNSFETSYPEVVNALSNLKINAVLDGEVVVLNAEGKPDFQKLQQWEHDKNFPIEYRVFDLLELNGKKLYDQPLTERKRLLSDLIKQNDVVKYSDHIDAAGEEFFEAVKKRDLEGMMAKKKDSRYYPGKRSADWLKIKHHQSDEAIIVGFTAPRGGRKYFGALVLGAIINGKLSYIGHTGSGFDSKLLKEIYGNLEPLITDKSPFSEKVKTNMPVTWVQPKYICELKFTEWTSDGKLRHPIFLRLRTDKFAEDVNTTSVNSAKAKKQTEDAEPDKDAGNDGTEMQSNKTTIKKAAAKKSLTKKVAAKKTAAKKQPAKHSDAQAKLSRPVPDVVENEKEKIYKFGKAELKTTNRTKIFFPEEGITKGQVIDYYDRMADVILPYLKNRPESLFRTPNGIKQKGFFQKDAGDEAPAWVDHIPLYSESVNKEIDYILCNNKATLLYMANLGCIEINPWHSQVKNLDSPDYMIIDIDPSDNNTFEQVVEAAIVVRQILDKAGAFSICKTSGASGLHIYVPMGKKYSYDQVKDFANIVCILANQTIPAFTTLERSLTKRSKDKIYMDYLQNRKGQTIASVYSMRPKKGGTVSTPLDWKEVKTGLTPLDFTLYTIQDRLSKKGDLFAPILMAKNAVDLNKCLKNLGG